jgi:glycosyltransferase involved in cell wall biosynthesis
MVELCFLVPVYNHAEGICNTIEALAKYQRTCIVVDDGSESTCRNAIASLGEQHSWVHVIHRPQNAGKGAAVKTGLSAAADLGFSHALQVDADEQHDLSAIDVFIEQSGVYPDATILGTPVFDISVPKVRHYSRYLTHVWVWINTLSFSIKDAMCGFRIYPVEATVALCNSTTTGDRMDFDTEVLVRLYWRGMKFINLPVRTYYPEDGVSHFRMLQDNWLITKMHARLFAGMLLRSPLLLKRLLKRRLKNAHASGLSE